MKKSAFLIVLFFLLMGMAPINTWAQDAPVPPQMFYVIEEFVEPADQLEFRKVQMEAVNLWREMDLDLSIYTYYNKESSYYWVIPISSFADIDTIMAKGQKLVADMKEKGYDGNEKFRDLSTSRQSVLLWSPELSYHPNGATGQTRDNAYCEWTYIYLKSGHDEEAAKAFLKQNEFFDGIDETWEWDTYIVMNGYDTPMWIVMTRAANKKAFVDQQTALQQKYSEKFNEMWEEMMPHIRKIEHKEGWFWPGWSLNFE